MCTVPLFWPFAIAYFIWMLMDKSPQRGGRRIDWVRRIPYWDYFVSYFPVSIVKVGCSVAVQHNGDVLPVRTDD